MLKDVIFEPLSTFLSEYTNKNIDNLYRPVIVGKYGIRSRETVYKKELAKDYSKNKLIYNNTLTVGMGSNQIDIGILTENNIYSVSPAYHTFKIRDVNPKYLDYCIRYFNNQMFEKCSKKSARQGKTIDFKEWLNFKIPVYDKETQQLVEKNLNNILQIIEIQKKKIELLNELIKSRFVELFGDARENPKGFDMVPFIDIVEYMGDIGSNGANKVVVDHLDMKDEEDYALMVRFTNFTKNDFSEDVKFISKEAYDFFKKSQIFGGELIICKIGSAGQNYVMPYLNRPVSLGLNQIMVRVTDNVLMPYLYQYLHTDYGEFLISGCINGAVTKTITKTELKKIPVMMPPMELQQQFAAFVKQVDKSKAAIQKSLDLYQELFDKLMNNYFGD